MAQRLLVLRKVQVSLVAGGIGSEANPLLRPVRKPQMELMVFLDRSRHRCHLCIVAEVAQEVRLFSLANVVRDMNGNMSVGFHRTALVLKLPEPQMGVLHRSSPSSFRRSPPALGHPHRQVPTHSRNALACGSRRSPRSSPRTWSRT